MRLLRTLGLILVLWAVAAIVYRESGVRSWIRTPSPERAERWVRKWQRAEELILLAGTAGIACLMLAARIESWKKMRPTDLPDAAGRP